MNVNRYIVGSIIVFVYLFIIEWLFHGVILSGWYQENLSLLRPESSAGGYFIWMLIGFLLMAFGFCYVFTKGYENKGVGEGFRYGLYVAVAFMISNVLINYSAFPWPAKWIIAWIIGYVIIMILAGIIFAAIYKPSSSTSTAAAGA